MALRDTEVIIDILADADPLRTLNREIDDITGNASRMGEGLTQAGQMMATGFGIAGAAIVGGLGIAVNTAMEFDAQMSRTGAIAGATSDQLGQLRDSALDLGASTSKSASEVAIAQEGLAALGFTVDDILGAMPGVISAAEASGADMAQTADVMASAINIFGLEATEATRVADILAETANRSAADINDMGYALKYAGPVAANLGVSMEELSASIGIMTNAGLDGSSAGTALRAGLLSLLNPSNENSKIMESMGIQMTDNNGKFIGLSGVVEQLGTSMEGMTDAQKTATLASLVGTEASSGFLALMAAGPAEIDKFTQSLEQSSGASATAATAMKDNLKGAFDEMMGSIETAQISIGSALAPALTYVAGVVGSLVDKFNALSPSMQSTIAIGAALTGVAFILIAGLGFLLMAVGGVVTAISALGGVAAIASTALAILTAPVTLVIAALVALGAAFTVLWFKSETFRNGIMTLWAALKTQLVAALNSVVTFFQGIGTQLVTWWQSNGTMIMAAAQNIVNYLVLLFQTWLPIFQGIWSVATTVVQLAWSVITAVIQAAISLITGIITFFAAVFTGNWQAAFDAVAGIVEAGRTLWTTVIDAALNAILEIVTTVLNTVYETFQSVWNNVTEFLGGIDLYSIGSDIMSGLLNGISDMGESVLKKAQEIAKGIKDTVAGFLGVASPSRVMMEIGAWTSEGMAIGMEKNIPMVENSSEGIAGAAAYSPEQGVSNTRSQSNRTITFAPQITVNGGEGGTKQDVSDVLEDMFARLTDLYDTEVAY
ncbi:phage tail tape measure protein [Exiguobacterium sp. s5]|uniref:phage tail tape measure protein n=1 Tax=Exiguobacterium sp. s5 TaxID=2751239 RepID=UPI001BE89B68|nr:phage tail tape measure protein [Exiguobacterium sp. s5]